MKFMKVLERDYTDKIATTLQSSASSIDLYLSMAHETSLNLLTDRTLQKYFLPEDLQTLNDKVERAEITNIISRANYFISDYTESLFVFNDDKKVYQSNGISDFRLFFGKFYNLKNYPTDFWSEQLQEREGFSLLPPTKVGSGNKMVVPFVTRGIVSGFETIVGITFPVSVLNKALDVHSIFPETEFVILNADNEVILNSNPDLLSPDRLAALNGQFYGTDMKHAEVAGFPTRSVAAYAQSDRYGWKYFSVTPMGAIHKNVNGLFQFIVLICTAMLAAGIIFSFLFSIKIYNPIKKIRDILEESEAVEETKENNEFEFIGSGIKRLCEKSSMIKNKFEKVSMEYLDHSIVNLLRGGSLDQEETIQSILLNECGFRSESYLCCSIQFDFQEGFYREIQDVDRLIILGKLKNVISGLIRDYVTGYVLEYKQFLYVCVINMEKNEDRLALSNALNHIINIFKFDFNYCKISIGVGSACSGLNNFPHSFNEAMTALQNRSDDRQFQIIDCQELSIQHHYYYSFVEENKIANLLKTGDLEQLKKAVRTIVRTNREKGVSHQNIHGLFSEMFNTGYKYAAEKELDIQQFISDRSQAQLKGQADFAMKDEEKVGILLHFYQKLTEHIAGEEKKTLPLVSVIIRYIEENYDKDLYLEKISEQFGVSSKYISRIFKENTGTNLTDYISMIRIAKAKQLLAETNLQISEIGEKIGIFNRTTFLRTFKKFEGISPTEYREAFK